MLLRAYRKKAGMSQLQIAEALGLSQATISQYESGDRTPGIRTIYEVIAVLKEHKVKCSVNDLFPPAG